jgi:hypothetical protein
VTNADADPDAFRRRVKQAIDELELRNAAHKSKLEGGSDAP